MEDDVRGLNELSNAELDRLAAEKILGWRVVKSSSFHYPNYFSVDGVELPVHHFTPTICTDHARMLEDKIENMGNVKRFYVHCLSKEINITRWDDPTVVRWRLLRATAKQRTLACLKAVNDVA